MLADQVSCSVQYSRPQSSSKPWLQVFGLKCATSIVEHRTSLSQSRYEDIVSLRWIMLGNRSNLAALCADSHSRATRAFCRNCGHYVTQARTASGRVLSGVLRCWRWPMWVKSKALNRWVCSPSLRLSTTYDLVSIRRQQDWWVKLVTSCGINGVPSPILIGWSSELIRFSGQLSHCKSRMTFAQFCGFRHRNDRCICLRIWACRAALFFLPFLWISTASVIRPGRPWWHVHSVAVCLCCQHRQLIRHTSNRTDFTDFVAISRTCLRIGFYRVAWNADAV